MGMSDLSRPPGRRRLRLTRRGRVVVVGCWLALVAGVAVLLAPSSEAADPPGPPPTAVVRPGDTLWSVAQRHRPDREPFRVIAEIRRLNGLEGYTIHAGQRLALPREE